MTFAKPFVKLANSFKATSPLESISLFCLPLSHQTMQVTPELPSKKVRLHMILVQPRFLDADRLSKVSGYSKQLEIIRRQW